MQPPWRRTVVLAVLTGVYVGCADEPTAPDESRTAPAEDTPLFSRTAAGEKIPDRYIVVFSDAVPDPAAAARTLVRAHAGTLHYTYRYALKGFAATLPPRAVAAIRRNPNVDYVEQDRVATAFTTQTGATWGIDRVDQRDLPLNGTYRFTATGAGVRAYVIDTGIRTGHDEFGGRASAGFDAFGGSGQDCNGHGTHVAGTVGGETYGIAKSVRLIAVRVLDCGGSGTISGVIAGVDWVTNNHIEPAVANMSLGGGASSALDDAVENSIAAGVVYAVAAGNSDANACNTSPARVGAALTVGATTRFDDRSSFSNFGSCLDVFAPGSGITSAWSTSDGATNTISGTSMASPHVAGVVALFLDRSAGSSPATVARAIRNTATPGVVDGAGSGSPDLLLNTHNGFLGGSGDSEYEPHDSYYFAGGSGAHRAWLRGQPGTDFDLYLYRWNGSSWVIVDGSTSGTSDEFVSFSGSAGYYLWRVYSFSGSGSYDLWRHRP